MGADHLVTGGDPLTVLTPPDKSSGESFVRPLQSLIQTSHKVRMSHEWDPLDTQNGALPHIKCACLLRCGQG